MDISKRKFATSILITALCAALLSYALAVQLQPRMIEHEDPKGRVNLFLCYERFSGKSWVESGNVITDWGENHTCAMNLLNKSATDYGLYWISAGNSSAVAAETQLDSQYGSRGLATISALWFNGGDASRNCTYQFQFTATVNINATGSHWKSTGDHNLYAVAALTGGDQTFNNGENLTVRWVYTYNCN